MTYPAGPAAATAAVTPARPSAAGPSGCQVVPLAEVNTAGPGAPTASQPARPCVTAVSVLRLWPAETCASDVTRDQGWPAAFRHTAG